MTAPAWPPTAPPEPPPATRRGRQPWLRRIVLAVLALLLLLAGAAAWALDRFVIDHVEIADVASYEAQQATGSATSAVSDAVVATDAVQEAAQEGAQVVITQGTTGTGDDAATYYVADVTFADITQLRSAFANNEYGLNIIADPSEIAEDVGASFAINGDYYGFRDTGIEIRNGVIYRDAGAREGAVIYADGSMDIYDETATTAQELVDAGAGMTLSFGPALVSDGEVLDGTDAVEIDTNVGNHSIQGDQPRTAIGMVSPLHYIFVVVDGRSSASAGVTLPEFAALMSSLGATEAYNLDGGGSSTMVSDGQVVNWPGGRGQERGTSDILWIG